MTEVLLQPAGTHGDTSYPITARSQLKVTIKLKYLPHNPVIQGGPSLQRGYTRAHGNKHRIVLNSTTTSRSC